MSAIPDTPGGPNKVDSYEFTPIGFVKPAERKKISPVDDETRKRLSEHSDIEDDEPPQKTYKHDNTLNSTRIFNESSFDDTLPLHNGMSEFRKNLVAELVDTEIVGQNGSASNPLKEQQESLHKLSMENYNLRVKCNSLLKFLNNVTDDGELRKNLEILDEIQQWKNKYQSLSRAYRDLQKKCDEPERGEGDSKREELESKVSTYELELSKSKSALANLEKRVSELHVESGQRDEQHKASVGALRLEMSDLQASIVDKTRELEESRKKIERLSNQLLEYDHQGGSLLELEKQLDLKNEVIRNLETRLRESNHERQSLERQLDGKSTELGKLNLQLEQDRKEASQKLTEAMASSAATGNEAKDELHSVLSQYDTLKTQFGTLEKENEALKEGLKKRDEQMTQLQDRIRKLQNELYTEQASVGAKASNEERKLKEKLSKLTEKLEQLSVSKQTLEKENEALKKQIIAQISKSPNLKQNNRRVLEKEKEIKLLKSTIQDLENEVAQYRRDISEIKRTHSTKMNELEIQLQNSESRPLLQSKKLHNEMNILKLELESVKDTKHREILILQGKCDALKAENEQLLKQDDNHSNQLRKLLKEKQQELTDLAQRCSDLTIEKLRLGRDLTQMKETSAKQKEELKATSSKLDYITNEFVKLRETAERPSSALNSNIADKWAGKYQSMKQKLLNEVKMLQDENLALEKRLLERRGEARPISNATDGSLLQDEVDYYKLRYHREVKQNNDLKVMNEYLNRVLRAGSQHLRLDILKLENEVPGSDKVFGAYPSRLKFKTVALFVLACVRFRSVALKHRWDDQRLTYLQRKIVMDQERITW
ncbi:LAFE_0F02850g1_1 [Lachancea fermentati]|uniref:Spindle pole body component 110 n=1 Tax=Lachancea fermentati TaxID=4955 RepID=A0A1G4MEP3_LACFM|nr:LAFE_0F02850g1_1 [Lachancea fermentati]